MSDPKYTPNTAAIRERWIESAIGADGIAEAHAEFDRWLNQVRADARLQGRAMGWDDAAVHIGGHNFDECDETEPPNPYREEAG